LNPIQTEPLYLSTGNC